MDSITHRELRNNSSAVLRRVAAGQTLVLTNDGEPVALLSPIASSSRRRVVSQGRLRLAAEPLDVASLPPAQPSTASLDELLADERGDR